MIVSNLKNIDYVRGGGSGLEARNTEDVNENVSIPTTSELLCHDYVEDRLKFQPPYFFSEWLDREEGMAKRLTVIVLLPSGISGADVDVEIIEQGCVLQMQFAWPKPFMKPESLCAAFIADQEDVGYNENHPEVIALEKELKDIRTANGLTRSRPITSKTHIRLAFEVETGRKEK